MRRSASVIACLTLLACNSSTQSTRPGSPLDDLPAWIIPLHNTGMRADWSADGSRLIFLDDLVGNVFEIEIESRKVRPLTAHFEHTGFTRARFLSNGGVLLCGPSEEATQQETEQATEQLALLVGDTHHWEHQDVLQHPEPEQRVGHRVRKFPPVNRGRQRQTEKDQIWNLEQQVSDEYATPHTHCRSTPAAQTQPVASNHTSHHF